MGSRTLIFSVFCLAASLAVACGTEDDAAPGGAGSGAAGRNGSAGAAGKSGGGNPGGDGGAPGGGNPGGGSENPGGGDAGEGGAGNECTPFAPFVHGLINDSTNRMAAPTPVNGLVFCDDAADPAAFKDLF